MEESNSEESLDNKHRAHEDQHEIEQVIITDCEVNIETSEENSENEWKDDEKVTSVSETAHGQRHFS